MNTINVEAGDMGLVVAFVLLLGGVIKHYTPVKNELIPLITWLLGGLLYQWLAGGWTDPRQWMMALISVAGATGLHSATRETVSAVGSKSPPPPAGPVAIILALTLFGATGCARLQPGADPIVVRTEQLLTTAQSTFLFTLQVDNKDRGFWRSKAPGFHQYCETLRRPTPYPATSTNLYPQYRVWLLSTDDVKLAYKAGRTSSNALFAAYSTLGALLEQANAWNMIITNRNTAPTQ